MGACQSSNTTSSTSGTTVVVDQNKDNEKGSKVKANKDHDYTLKMLLIGDSGREQWVLDLSALTGAGVGKTSLLLRFVDDTFHPGYMSTIGIDFKFKIVDLDGRKVKLQIWDTAGQERFRTITAAYFRGAHGIMMCYDVTNRATFNNVRNWARNIDQHAGDKVTRYLVGLKADLADKRVVSTEEGKQLADEFGIKFSEASAKNSLNVEDIFMELSRDAKKRLAEAGLLA